MLASSLGFHSGHVIRCSPCVCSLCVLLVGAQWEFHRGSSLCLLLDGCMVVFLVVFHWLFLVVYPARPNTCCLSA